MCYAIHMTEFGKAIERIRKFFAARPTLSRTAFAGRAELHRNTLYNLQDHSWNPTRASIEKCLGVIDKIEQEEAAGKRVLSKSPTKAAA